MKTPTTKHDAYNALADALTIVNRVFAAHKGDAKLPLTEDQLRHIIDARQSLNAATTAFARQIQHPQHFEDLPILCGCGGTLKPWDCECDYSCHLCYVEWRCDKCHEMRGPRK